MKYAIEMKNGYRIARFSSLARAVQTARASLRGAFDPQKGLWIRPVRSPSDPERAPRPAPADGR